MSECDKYEVLEKIGHGSFGVIRKVRRKQDGQILCRKEISYLRMSQKEREQLHAEFAILSSLRHPNIVGYYHREHLKSTQDLHLYMEYCGNGDLGRVIQNLVHRNEYADENFVWSMFAQLTTALYRCHYGTDPPEPTFVANGAAKLSKPKQPVGSVMILHRDLKPENVFLGEDNSVKLGDFGLSKIMQSHDFASTYVGTPFYMSPEICAAERYTLKSDVWSLGCIMYELCSREPPFNAKTHFQLIQKIKEGRLAPLPSIYSVELRRVISDCLLVNPDRRPDTASLLDIPPVKLVRREREMIILSKSIKKREEMVAMKILETEEKSRSLDAAKIQMQQDIETKVRKEWEVKAQLEINRQVQIEIDRLQKKFDEEVRLKVEAEVGRRENNHGQSNSKSQTVALELSESGSNTTDKNSRASQNTDEDDIFDESPDVPNLFFESLESMDFPKRRARTPFVRAQTMFAATPMDIEMAEPSPISIASLSLSPRRNALKGRNIFANANGSENRWQPTLTNSDESDDDDLPPVPSPTRAISAKNQARVNIERSSTMSQKSTQMQKKSGGLASKTANTSSLPSLSTAPELQPKKSNNALREMANSPNRRLSKIPSSTNLTYENTPVSPQRKISLKRHPHTDDLNKLATKNMTIKTSTTNIPPKGRTLVELAQARAGGRPIHIDANRSPEPKGRPYASRTAEKTVESNLWDPERDDMPSPFLVRTRAPIRRL
ncbi:Bgt-663 [Blumeria graminis f. sp. tritici]|uniref:non-specific serine/threonine protein kinase n=2 Tax=Blumeria graminis f. sp. tritici TaxID=62690 RepID=A0A381LGR1_BLUGR|nr:protein kinase [Blumeria graminis f. sp. tritici 96224]VDB95291.1 Bgt-663 [Blumeria graminis f. sp. tritici]